MSLFDDASLVLIPDGAKDGTLYSVKPTDGTGDFTFTRGSNLAATRVDENGLIEKGRENLLLQSNSFDTTWTNSNTTETSGQSGYDGSTDAWKIDKSVASGYITQSISQNSVQTFSVYAKAGTLDWVRLVAVAGTDQDQYFDLSTGTLGATGTNIDAVIDSAGGGWYRCSIALSQSVTSVRIYPADDDNDVSGATGNIYIQDAQLEQGLVATDYIETGATTAQAGILEDLPRIDYSGGASCPALLLEPQRTNVLAYSEYFGASYWTKNNSSVTDNVATSPEGLNNACLFAENTATSTHEITKSITNTLSADYCISIFAKANTRNWIRLSSSDGGFVYFNLATGEKGIETNATGIIEPFGDGWYKCSIVFEALGTNGSATIRIAKSDGVTSYTGSSKSVYLYGFQYEAASYPSSYVPTYGTSVTRGADVCGGAGDSSLFNDSEGVLFIETAALADDGTSRRISISSGATSNRVEIVYQTSGRVDYQVTSGNVFQAGGFGSITQTDTNKIAVKYKANDFALWINGTEVSTDSSGLTPVGISQMRFEDGAGGNDFYGKVKQAIYFDSALTDTELAALTTP